MIGRTLPAAGVDLLRDRFTVEVGGDRPHRGWLAVHVPGAAAIVADPSVTVDGALLDAGRRDAQGRVELRRRLRQSRSRRDSGAWRAGDEHAGRAHGFDRGARGRADACAAGRRVAEGDALVRRGEWAGWGADEFLGRDLAGATVGLIGFGRIGRRVAQLLAGFGVRLRFYSRGGSPEQFGAEPCELSELLAGSDFVSLHVPLTPSTRHLIDAVALALMKPGAILVNTSRGAVVDTPALVDALRTGRLGAAGLDVYEDEPHVPAELCRLTNTVLLPHVGSATVATRDAMARLCAENVIAVIDGREPPTPLVL